METEQGAVLEREAWQRKQGEGKSQICRDLAVTMRPFQPETDLINPSWTLKFGLHLSGWEQKRTKVTAAEGKAKFPGNNVCPPQ